MALQDVGIRAVISGLAEFTRGTAEMERSTGAIGVKTIAVGALVAEGFSRMAAGVRDAASSIVDFSATLQESSISFRVMLGSAEAAQSMMEGLKQFTQSTPFEFPQVLKAAENLLAYGTVAEDIVPTLTMLGNISRGSAEKLSLLQLAFGQVQASTKLTGAELRQFTESGVPLLQGLADKFGVTTGEMQQLISEGKVGFRDVRDVLQQMATEGGKFGNAMEEGSKSFRGAMSNVSDALNFAVEKSFRPFFEQMTSGALAVGAFLNTQEFRSFADQVGQAMATASAYIGDAITVLSNLAELVSYNTPLLEAMAYTIAIALTPSIISATLAFVAMAAPIVGTGLLLGALASAIYLVINNWDIFEQAGAIVMDVLSGIANTIGSVVGPALSWLYEKFGQLTSFLLERFKTLAQIAAIAGDALGFDVSYIIQLVDRMNTGNEMAGWAATWDNAVSIVSNSIGAIVDKAKVGLNVLPDLFDAVLERLRRPITFGGGVIPKLPPIVFSDDGRGPSPAGGGSGGSGSGGSGGKSAAEAKAEREATVQDFREDASIVEAALRAIQQRAESLGESLRKALGSDEGSVLDRVQKGLAAFAKAEWVSELEARINVVSAEIQKAVSEGLDPSSIIESSKDLFAAYADAVSNAAEKLAEKQKQLEAEWAATSKALWDEVAQTRAEIFSASTDLYLHNLREETEASQRAWDERLRIQRQATDLMVAQNARLEDKGNQQLRRENMERLARIVEAAASGQFAGVAGFDLGALLDRGNTIMQIAEALSPTIRAGNTSLGDLIRNLGGTAKTVALPAGFGGGTPDMVSLPIGSSGGATTNNSTTYAVTANYSQVQEPQALKYDLETIALLAGR